MIKKLEKIVKKYITIIIYIIFMSCLSFSNKFNIDVNKIISLKIQRMNDTKIIEIVDKKMINNFLYDYLKKSKKRIVKFKLEYKIDIIFVNNQKMTIWISQNYLKYKHTTYKMMNNFDNFIYEYENRKY